MRERREVAREGRWSYIVTCRWIQRLGTLRIALSMLTRRRSKPPVCRAKGHSGLLPLPPTLLATMTQPARVRSLSNQVCHSPPP